MLKTRNDRDVRIRAPNHVAGMNWITEPQAGICCMHAGGLGILALPLHTKETRELIRQVRDMTESPSE